MSLNIDLLIDYDLYTAESVDFADASNYGISTILIDSVNCTRFLFSSVLAQDGKAEGVTQLIAGTQYILVGTGSIVVDTKTYSAGDVFIPLVDATPSIPSTLSVDETGWYGVVTDYLPSVNKRVTFTPTQMGDGSSSLVCLDTIREVKYEIYTTKYEAGSVSVSQPTQFIVKGGVDGKIVIGGVTYRVGEVFTKSTTFTFSNFVGINYVCQYYDSNTKPFMTYHYANLVYEEYIDVVSVQTEYNQYLVGNFLKVHTLLNANLINIEKAIGLDLSNMQNNLDTINTIYANQDKFL